MAADDFLTTMRHACWDAIDNWPKLKGRLKRTYRFDEEASVLQEAEPSLSDMPALALWPTDTRPEGFVHDTKFYPLHMGLVLWTPHWTLPKAEELWKLITESFWKSTPDNDGVYVQFGTAGATTSYVKHATGYHPWAVGSIAMERVRLGQDQKVKAVRTRWAITLKTQFNPYL